jgi:hypothetical protein
MKLAHYLPVAIRPTVLRPCKSGLFVPPPPGVAKYYIPSLPDASDWFVGRLLGTTSFSTPLAPGDGPWSRRAEAGSRRDGAAVATVPSALHAESRDGLPHGARRSSAKQIKESVPITTGIIETRSPAEKEVGSPTHVGPFRPITQRAIDGRRVPSGARRAGCIRHPSHDFGQRSTRRG